jgi:hypothetical protein
VAQGGDWGAVITELMGVQAPPELLGIHTNMANVIPPDIDMLAFSGSPAPASLSADEKLAYERLSFVYSKGRPTTLSTQRDEFVITISVRANTRSPSA